MSIMDRKKGGILKISQWPCTNSFKRDGEQNMQEMRPFVNSFQDDVIIHHNEKAKAVLKGSTVYIFT